MKPRLPGAGKGNLVKAAQFEFSDNIVPIDPDAQRELHPDFKKLREAHPYTWSGHTHYDANRWAGELRDATVAGRRNLIVDTTLGNADGAIQTIKGLQAKGYSVEARDISTRQVEGRRQPSTPRHRPTLSPFKVTSSDVAPATLQSSHFHH